MLRKLLGNDKEQDPRAELLSTQPQVKAVSPDTMLKSAPSKPTSQEVTLEKEIPRNSKLTLKVTSQSGGNLEAYKNSVCLSDKHRLSKKGEYLVKFTDGKHDVYYPVIFKPGMPESDIQISGIARDSVGAVCEKSVSFELVERDQKAEVSNIYEMSIHIDKLLLPPGDHLDDALHVYIKKLEFIIQDGFEKNPLCVGQSLVVKFSDSPQRALKFTITEINGSEVNLTPFRVNKITRGTRINFTVSDEADKQLTLSPLECPLSLDFTSKGIGGHHGQLEQLMRSAFYSRAIPLQMVKDFGIKHTKGVLLYGPPGTGKTLIAREISHLFSNKDNVHYVNGPELQSRFVGQGQQNLGDIFAPAAKAWERYGEKADLHVFIFDEIDALLPPRGTRTGGTGADDAMVSRFLTLLDGTNSPQNILVIGTTNRKELIDPAVLRPGRLSAHLEISIPDEEGRLEILQIKTKEIREKGLLDPSVDLKKWAEKTENFTGAEIEDLVEKAKKFAISSSFDSHKKEIAVRSSIHEVADYGKVTQQHFLRSFSEITPAFGVDKSSFDFDKSKFVLYNETLRDSESSFERTLEAMKTNKDFKSSTFLITGESGTGKTDLAKYLATLSNAKYKKMISASDLLKLSIDKQIDFLIEQFHNASLSEFSVLVLDGLEGILQANPSRTNCEPRLLSALDELLNKLSHCKNKCIVIATARSKTFVETMGLDKAFDEANNLAKLSFDYNNAEDIKALLDLVVGLGYHLDNDKQAKTNKDGTRKITMTIKELVHALRILRPTKEDKVSLNQIFDFINKKPISRLDKKVESTVGMLGARQRVFAARTLTAEAGTQQIELGHDLPKMAAK